jgi:hypothetical protein
MSQPQQQPSPKRVRRWPLLALALIFVGTVAVLIALKSGGNHDRDTEAATQCQQAARERLKAPSSAVFDHPAVTVTPGQTADFYTVTGTVDAQNAYGAMLRNE